MKSADDEFGTVHPIKSSDGVYHPTRFESLFMAILPAILHGESPKAKEKAVERAYQLAAEADRKLREVPPG